MLTIQYTVTKIHIFYTQGWLPVYTHLQGGVCHAIAICYDYIAVSCTAIKSRKLKLFSVGAIVSNHIVINLC